jgi:hypothetical protein
VDILGNPDNLLGGEWWFQFLGIEVDREFFQIAVEFHTQ